MANVSYLRLPIGERRSVPGAGGAGGASRRFRPGRYLIGGALLVIAVVAAGALVLVSARASLTGDQVALAQVGMPLGGGSIQSVTAVTGPNSPPVPLEIRGSQIWPVHLIPANETLSIQVVVKRPGWISWLAGKTQKLHLSVTTPTASLDSHYLTLAAGAPLRLHFKAPVRSYAYGSPGHLQRHVLAAPSSVVTLPRSAEAGSIFVSATPRSWESSGARLVDWFPAGAGATVVADPAPGSTIKPGTSIMLTFSKPIANALGAHRPPVSPITQGVWHTVNSHTIIFRPAGYGYGLGAKVDVALPAGVRLVGGAQSGSSEVGTWTVPAGSTVRLQEILSLLGYLPLTFHYHGSGVGLTVADQEAAAMKPPAGRFTWTYPNTPSALHGLWLPGASGVMTKGALMAFENDQGMTTDGVASPPVWKALIAAVIAGHRSSFGYTFVSVSEGSPESLTVWHSGKTPISGTPVNTGIAAAPTATGVYAVFEHAPSVTMSGYNPDGSYYSDPGIPWVSYFNGGDALHGYIRASYGFPQSLGCVEMPYAEAGLVYPYTPMGTLVDVS